MNTTYNELLSRLWYKKEKFVTRAYYATILSGSKADCQVKRPRGALRKVLFHYKNVSAHPSTIILAKLMKLEFQLHEHPLYYLNLTLTATCPQYGRVAGKKRIFSNEDTISGTNAEFVEWTYLIIQK